MDKLRLIELNQIKNVKSEIQILKILDHPHIIKFHTRFEDPKNIYIVLEYAENGNVFDYLQKNHGILENEAFVYFFQTCLGIDYLHKKRIIHRDLKVDQIQHPPFLC